MKIVFKSNKDKQSSNKKNKKAKKHVESVKNGEHKKNCSGKKKLLNSICSESPIKANDTSKANKPNHNFSSEENILVDDDTMDWQDIAIDMNAPEFYEPNIDYSDEILTDDKEQKMSYVKYDLKKRNDSTLLANYLSDKNTNVSNKTFDGLQESGLAGEGKNTILLEPNEYNTTSNNTLPLSNYSNSSNDMPLNNVNMILCYFFICLFVSIWVYVISLIIKAIKSRFNSPERTRGYSLFIQQNKR